MTLLRILFVSILAALAACPIASLILSGTIERASFVPLVFALPGSLLLTTAYGKLSEQGYPLHYRYVALVTIGLIVGGLMLGFISSNDGTYLALGSFYGAMTALCWIALHAATRPRARRAVDGFKARVQ